jgi:hypothetical protein
MRAKAKIELVRVEKTPDRKEIRVRPLEGLEHVLSILHSGVERQLPRNYADFQDHNDIRRRPKTANGECNAGKKRARLASPGAGLKLMPEMNAGKTVLGIGMRTRF